MTHPNPSTAMAEVIADELIRNGLRRAVVSPGSRSTALVLAMARLGFELTVDIDERSAGFRALGHSVGGDHPGVVVTTSGSAVANLLPAVVEADRAGVPLLLLTADRPRELVERRTNQTMDQQSVFSGYARRRVDLGPAIDDPGSNEAWRSSVASAVAAAVGGGRSPGPSHLNVAFEEPTVPVTDDGRIVASVFSSPTAGRDSGGPWDQAAPSVEAPSLPVDLGERTLVIAGRGDYLPDAVLAAARDAGFPVLATALSGCRGDGVITTYHHLLAAGVPAGLAPETVVVIGQQGPSDRLGHLMPEGTTVVHVDRWGQFSDVSGTMTAALAEDPAQFLERAAARQDPGWADAWHSADKEMRATLDGALDSIAAPTGPGVARAMNGLGWQALVVGSSLPIRDVDAQLTRRGWVHSNRGLSGIDGFASTALGIADLRRGTVALCGDLSFLHDSNAFLTDRLPPAVFVIVDNGGGGLFDLLPQAHHAPDFERFFTTPHDRDLGLLAEFHRLAYVEAGTIDDVVGEASTALTAGTQLVIRVAVDRKADLSARRALDEVARARSGQ